MLRDVPLDLWGQVKAQAQTEDVSLRVMVLELLRRGLDGPRSVASLGGRARAEAMSADARRANAQQAARARWDRPREE